MKNFCITLTLLSFFGILIELFLPKGKTSPLYAPLKFLLSLSIILCLFSPVIRFTKGEVALPKVDFSSEDIPSGEELVKERVYENIYSDTKGKFPQANFSLDITYENGYIPKKILINCPSEEDAQDIRDYIKIKYGIETE